MCIRPTRLRSTARAWRSGRASRFALRRRQPDRARPLVDALPSRHFDTEYTARRVLGAHWRGATEEQRRRFGSALCRTFLSTYAGAVAEWTPDQLRILPLRGDPAALQVVVRTEVRRPGSAIVPVDYRLHRTAAEWMIFDVVVGSISYVRNDHDDVDGEVAQKGLDPAIARLEKRNDAAAHAPRPLPTPGGSR